MADETKTKNKTSFSFALPGAYLGWIGIFILFSAFTGNCNLWGCGFQRDYLGEILDNTHN